MAALLFSAFGPIWLNHRLEQKTAQKVCEAMPFLLFTLNFR